MVTPTRAGWLGVQAWRLPDVREVTREPLDADLLDCLGLLDEPCARCGR